MEFDRPLTMTLEDEPELVVAGMTAMLTPYAGRVTFLAADRDGPNGEPPLGADLRLHDPFATYRHRPTVPVPGMRSKVIVYTWETRPGFVDRAMASGISGYISKALPASELVVALEKVYSGELFVALDDPQLAPAYPAMLTPRESDVVACITSGMSNQEIADHLHLSMNTVKSHIRTAYQTMGVTSRTQALLWALEHGVTRDDEDDD